MTGKESRKGESDGISPWFDYHFSGLWVDTVRKFIWSFIGFWLGGFNVDSSRWISNEKSDFFLRLLSH